MPLPRYSLDDAGEGDEETFEESYPSNAAASSSRLGGATSSLGDTSFAQPPSVSGVAQHGSPSSSLSAAYDGATSSLDIDALLSSTNAHGSKGSTSSKSYVASSGWPYSPSSPMASMTPFEQLTLFMGTQKAAPELLPFPTTAFERLISQMEQQQSILDSLLHISHPPTHMDTDSSDATAEIEADVDEDEFLRLNLVQVDLERCKWLLKQILRSRMDLLQKYAGFIESKDTEKRKLNASETTFVTEYWQMKKDHFHTSVLAFLPDQLHELSSGQTEASLSQQEEYQPNNSSNMVPGPDLDAPVFVRCLQDCGSIQLPDGEQATLSNDSVHLLRYRSIRHLVYQGSVTLL